MHVSTLIHARFEDLLVGIGIVAILANSDGADIKILTDIFILDFAHDERSVREKEYEGKHVKVTGFGADGGFGEHKCS